MRKNCIYLKQKLDKTIYCNKEKKTIKIGECSYCNNKQYNKVVNKQKVNHKSSKRTQHLAITKKVKMIVWERDNHKCIFCNCLVPWNLANSHYIKRSHGGLGIEQNIFCACLNCHNKFDDSKHRKDMLPIAKKHFKQKYKNWDENNLYYNK